MSIRLLTRYGSHKTIEDPTQFRSEIRSLIDELCTEMFERPDYEHYQVSVSHSNDWSISAYMDGYIRLGQYSKHAAEDRYLYGLSKSELEDLFMMLAEGRIDQLLELKWAESIDVLEGRGDHYLLLNHPDMTDLHRAAAKGDCEWVRAELAAGADIESRDEEGLTPLHWAAMAGQDEACMVLLASGADVNASARNGETAIELAESSDEYIGKEGANALVTALCRWRDGERNVE